MKPHASSAMYASTFSWLWDSQSKSVRRFGMAFAYAPSAMAWRRALLWSWPRMRAIARAMAWPARDVRGSTKPVPQMTAPEILSPYVAA